VRQARVPGLLADGIIGYHLNTLTGDFSAVARRFQTVVG
jgi:hypothetical protein